MAFAGRFFGPMYRRASVLQVAAAFVGTAAGILAWLRGSRSVWLAGSVLLLAVVPFTLLVIMPVNKQLLAQGRSPDPLRVAPAWYRLGVALGCLGVDLEAGSGS